jgi:threonine/homoserine/homoserine lactone efflux protein
VIGLTAVVVIVLAVADPADAGTDEGASDTVSWVKVILGLGLIFLGWREWRGRPRAGEEPRTPGWMSTIDDFTTVKSLGLGILLSGLNPKNLMLAVAASGALAQLNLSSGDTVGAVVVFVVIASLSIAGPVLIYLFGGEGVRHWLDELKEWLNDNNATVMSVLFFVLGFVVLGQGIRGLSD